MSTAREGILLAFVGVAGTVPGLKVFRSRDASIARAELPALVVQPEEETVDFLASGISRRQLTVLFTVLIRSEPPDQGVDPYVQQLHAAIMRDPTLGGTVGRTIERGTKWTIETGDVTGLACEIRYEVTYATPASDLSLRY